MKHDDQYNENENKHLPNIYKECSSSINYQILRNPMIDPLNTIKDEDSINECMEKRKIRTHDEENVQKNTNEDFNQISYKNKETYEEKIKKLIEKKHEWKSQ